MEQYTFEAVLLEHAADVGYLLSQMFVSSTV